MSEATKAPTPSVLTCPDCGCLGAVVEFLSGAPMVAWERAKPNMTMGASASDLQAGQVLCPGCFAGRVVKRAEGSQ